MINLFDMKDKKKKNLKAFLKDIAKIDLIQTKKQ